MSQHIYSTVFNGQPATIMMGWDRPMQGFFLVVELDDFSEDDESEGLIYSNLDDKALKPFGGFARATGYLSEKLASLGLAVPSTLLEQVELDGASNAGNRHVVYGVDGGVLSDAPTG